MNAFVFFHTHHLTLENANGGPPEYVPVLHDFSMFLVRSLVWSAFLEQSSEHRSRLTQLLDLALQE